MTCVYDEIEDCPECAKEGCLCSAHADKFVHGDIDKSLGMVRKE